MNRRPHKRKRDTETSRVSTSAAEGREKFAVVEHIRRYKIPKGNGKISCMHGFATEQMCVDIIALCEEEGFRVETGKYEQATVDVEVDSFPRLKRWLLRHDLVNALRENIHTATGQNICAFDDVFVVKYDANEQRDLIRHYDAADVSFMLALSERNSYAGGGTWFDSLGDTVHLDAGELIIFDAGLYHSGMPISKGLRYLLVGFCYTRVSATREDVGNLSLSLEKIHGNRNRFEAWQIDGISKRRSWKEMEDAVSDLRQRLDSHPSSPTSCWVGCSEHTKEGTVEHFAQKAFWYHMNRLGMKPSPNAGAEIWVQRIDCKSGIQGDTIPWHRDKDEVAFASGRGVKFPAVATVTYISNGGLPTVVFDMNGTIICFPRRGNHLAFSGELLHGCPSCFRKFDIFGDDSIWKQEDSLRVTLLINMWPDNPPDRSTFLPISPRRETCTKLAHNRETLEMHYAYVKEVSVNHVSLSTEKLKKGSATAPHISPEEILNQKGIVKAFRRSCRPGADRSDVFILVPKIA